MSHFRRHPALFSGVSLVLLAVYLVASFGVIPSPQTIKGWFGQVSGERYPCESCGCGCASANECWTHCCCHSEHERLVWAIENGVMPPKVVEFSNEQWIAASNAIKPGSAHCVMCVERIKGELRRGIATQPVHGGACECGGSCDGHCGKACCETKTASKSASGSSCCAKGGDEKKASWPGPSISALSCKGLQQLLTMTLPPAPPMRVVDFILPEPAVFVPERPKDVAYPSRTLDVPEPPPRVIAILG
ncbi:MAG: hypothetical protein U0640_14265 [Phycisphaerales bacterium]